ncbi:MAG: DUF4430 domain-containing protein [Candidatus Paceibacterota bacterium]
MNKKEKIKIGVIIIFSILLGTFSLKFFQTRNSILPPFPSPYVGKDKIGIKEIDTVFTDDILGQITVYDFMNKLQKEGKINFKDKEYTGMGKFIEEINGIKNSDKYWIYYVNGKKAEIGISNYKINYGDIVSWKYESQY